MSFCDEENHVTCYSVLIVVILLVTLVLAIIVIIRLRKSKLLL